MTPAAPLNPDWARVRRFVVFAVAATVVLLLLAVLYHSMLAPLAVAAFMAYLLKPLVGSLEAKGVPRWAAVASIVVVCLASISVAAVWLIPLVYQQAVALIATVPGAVETVTRIWLPMLEKYVTELGLVAPEEVHRLLGGASLLDRFEAQLQAGLAGLWRTGTSLANSLVYGILTPIIAFFMLKDYPEIRALFRRAVPDDLKLPMDVVIARVNRTLRTVLKGQAIVAGILGVLYVVGLSITGLKAAIVIGVVAGICRFVPYLDVVVGGALAAVVLLADFQGWAQVLSVVLVFLVVQGIDGAFITPAVMGERIGLHPLVVIVSVLAFAAWLGFWGVILAIPIVAIVKELVAAAWPYYQASRAYRGSAKSEEIP
jgi:predicted PurR-regulated permease PerM